MRLTITGLLFLQLFTSANAQDIDLRGKSILYENPVCKFAMYMSKNGNLFSEYSDDSGGKGMVHKTRQSCQTFTLKLSGRSSHTRACGKYTIRGNKLFIETTLNGKNRFKETFTFFDDGRCSKRNNKGENVKSCRLVSGRQIYVRC